MPLTGGFPAYAERCARAAANGYEGFRVADEPRDWLGKTVVSPSRKRGPSERCRGIVALRRPFGKMRLGSLGSTFAR